MPKKPAVHKIVFHAKKPVRHADAQLHFSESGHIAVKDDKGKHVPELEKPWPLLWAEHAESLGHDPAKFTLITPSGKSLKLVRHIDGITWKIS